MTDGASSTSWWRPLRRGDRWALVAMVVVPVVLFVVPALLGHPAIDADDLIQNFPLRVLAGRQLASGHLPLLDPLTNAGTPLLGGMNAGALYPLTMIFAFIPALAAWVINLIVVYVAAATGVFVLLRWHGLGTSSSLVAAFSYAYSGAMIGQIVHLGVIQGYSFLPWALVVMLASSRRLGATAPDARARDLAVAGLPWALAFAVVWGLTFLSGEPRAIADVELLTIVVAPSVLVLRSSYWLDSWRRRAAYVLTLGVGFAGGVGLGLIQLLPGWSFITFSERSNVGYSFFGAGSLPVRWSALLLTPDLFGGNGALGQQGYFANYNLAEVTGYAGVLALVAAAAFATRCTRRGWRGAERDFTPYVVLGVVGLFATWGNFTPLGHLFRALPLFGSTRLQSRNVILVDLVLALLLGWWLEQVRRGDRRRAGLGRGARWITAAPALAVAALSAVLLEWGPAVIEWVHISVAYDYMEDQLRLLNSVHLVVALAALAVVLLVRSRRLFTWLVIVLAVDLVVFSLFSATGLVGGPGPREPSRASAAALLGTKGRFALVDLSGIHTGQFRALGQPNMNVFTGLESVQGYGSLISTIYDDATGTHPQNMVNVCHLAEGTFVQLRLDSVAIASQLLMARGSLATAVPETCVHPTATTSTERYFGQELAVDSITLAGADGARLSSGPLELRLLDAAGSPVGPAHAAAGASSVTFRWSHATRAAGFEVLAAHDVRVANAVVTTSDGDSYQLDGAFQLALDSSEWRLSATVGTVAVFKATSLLPEAWLRTSASGRVSAVRNASWGDTWVSVALSRPDVLIRSEAYLPGWRATALNVTTGRSVELTVRRHGLIQSVEVPRGRWVIHFHYHAPYIELASATSAASLVALVGVASAWWVVRRRGRKGKVLT